MIPPKIGFLILQNFLASLGFPIRKEDGGKIHIVLATNSLNKEFLGDGDSSIETYLWNTYFGHMQYKNDKLWEYLLKKEKKKKRKAYLLKHVTKGIIMERIWITYCSIDVK